jgi:BirA family transcriptional regulator, biotin operon repressor / biotin---[acetyl-CoA-carboxylase] ligase
VLGLGLNVATAAGEFPQHLRASATSLAAESAEAAAPGAGRLVESLLKAVLERLAQWLAAPHETVLDAWRSRDALRGKAVRWRDGDGTAAGISNSGALLVETTTGRVELDAGEVHLLRSD